MLTIVMSDGLAASHGTLHALEELKWVSLVAVLTVGKLVDTK